MASDVSFGVQVQRSQDRSTKSRLSILVSNLRYNIPITIYVESNPEVPTAFETELVDSWDTRSEEAKDEALHQMLGLVREKYATSAPLFGTCPFIRTTSEGALSVIEELDPRMLQHVKRPNEILLGAEPLPLISRELLSPYPFTPSSPKSWSSQISLTTLKRVIPGVAGDTSMKYVAKGPSRLSDFTELRTLLRLPQHPHIPPRPLALIIVSDTDDRVLGFLLEYYPLGNLDNYAGQLHAAGKLPAEKLWDWGRQLVSTVHWLHVEQHTFHQDIKPDNILLAGVQGGHEQLMLIDFSQDAFTAVTCAPELRESWNVALLEGLLTYNAIPKEGEEARQMADWPAEAKERADVYALGRTLHVLAKSASMTELYMKLYEDCGYTYDSAWEDGDLPGEVGIWLRSIVERCTARNPLERPLLQELKTLFDGRLSESISTSECSQMSKVKKSRWRRLRLRCLAF